MSGFLDAFEIVGLAGEGAMAQVWHAVHRELRTPVALKVITARFAKNPQFQTRFAREIRLISRLNIRGIIRLYDHGHIPSLAATNPNFQFDVGTPYCLMEWMPEGTLHERIGNMQWTELRATLLCLLEALAAAHSNLIIHRDLKPKNVLMSARGPVISDFGIAYGQDIHPPDEDTHAFVGTPNYMSPEQIRGDWRAFGPWTDLYALGCLVYTVLCGRPPFPVKTFGESIEAHLKSAIPPLQPLVPVPEGLDEWLKSLMAKRPKDRFQLAADAALSLLEFPDEIPLVDGLGNQVGVWHEGEETIVAPPVFVPVTDTTWATEPVTVGRPGLPTSWAQPSNIGAIAPLPGLGRSLFNLAAAPFCGRIAERDQLWTLLCSSVDRHQVEMALIHGTSGVGKTVLSRWIGRRAHEVGAALPMLITHQNPNGEQCGLRGLINQIFKCEHLDLDERSVRIEAQAEAFGLGRYTEVYDSMSSGLGSTVGNLDSVVMYTLNERFEALSQLVKALTSRRPRVLVVDDGQWGAEALSFVRYLRRRHRDMPVLILVTVRIDVLPTQSPQATSLARLASEDGTLELHLGPLSSDAHRELLVSRLVLDPEVVEHLEERTNGNPLFTEELVRHWIRSEVLEPGPRGFRLRPTVDKSIPDTIYGVWAMRIEHAFSRAEVDARHSVQIAAVLGHRVSLSEWQAVCARAHLPADAPIIERLLSEHMIEATVEDEFEFTHVLLRESLQRAADEDACLERWHSLCADVLLTLEDVEPMRLAEHLFSARRYHEASEYFGTAAKLLGNVSDYAGAQRALIRWALTLRRLEVDRSSKEWLTIRTRWAVCMRVQGQSDYARRHAQHNVKRARETLFYEETATALVEWLNHIPSDNIDEILETVDEGITLADRTSDTYLKCRFLNASGRALSQCGRLAEARTKFEEVLSHEPEYRQASTEAYLGLGHICEIQGDHPRALGYARKADELGSQSTSRWEQAHCRNTLGNALRKMGELEEAETMYRQAADMLGLIGNIDVWASHANIGLLMIEVGRPAEALEAFEAAKTSAGGRNDAVVQACLDGITLLAEAHLCLWESWDIRIGLLEKVSIWHETQLDVAISLARAANEAARAGQSSRAQRGWRLALTVFKALGLEQRGQHMYAERPNSSSFDDESNR